MLDAIFVFLYKLIVYIWMLVQMIVGLFFD